ncbi:MAG: hypothetical protein AAFZ63_27850 [Bacteroidota bacterium]
MIQSILSNLKNIPGWSSKVPLLVIESDDWGSTRMPSKEAHDYLLERNIRVDKNRFTILDTLASEEDLDLLFEVLNEVAGSNGRPAVFTPFVNVTNADFEAIIRSEFREYHYERFDHTLMKYHGKSVFQKWKQGLENGIFIPQYHGREHFNVPYLMTQLQAGDEVLRTAFRQSVIHAPLAGLPRGLGGSLAPTYFYHSAAELEQNLHSVRDGIEIFKDALGYQPLVFGPPNGIFDLALEKALDDSGIRGIVVNRTRWEPDGAGGLKGRNFLWKFGAHNAHQQVYYRRNVKFEPVQPQYSAAAVKTNIASAFRWCKPAILSSHRINYVGTLEVAHRDKALQELRSILKWVVKTYPEVQFIGSGELVTQIRGKTS